VRSAVLLLLLSACTPDASGTLLVDLRTDYAAQTDFDAVVVTLEGETRTYAPEPSDDYAVGVRVATFEGAPNPSRLTLRLERDGALVAERPAIVEVRGDAGVTITITRRCAELACDSLSDTPSCLGNRCVPAGCLTGAEPECPPAECSDDVDCEGDANECTVPRCLDATCLAVPDDGRCASGRCGADGCVGPGISHLEVLDRSTGEVVQELLPGDSVLDLDLVPTHEFVLLVVPEDAGSVASVVVERGMGRMRVVRSTAPFAVNGRDPDGDYRLAQSWIRTPASPLVVTPYAGSEASGEAGPSQEFVIQPEQSLLAAMPSIAAVELVDAETGVRVRELTDGEVLSLATLPAQWSILVRTSPTPVGRTCFEATPEFRTSGECETYLPYAMFADDDGELETPELAPGLYEIDIELFPSIHGGVLAATFPFAFTIVE